MQVSRLLFVVASGAVAMLLTGCQWDADRHTQPAVETAVAESHTESAREDAALAEQRRLAGELASLQERRASLAQSFSEQEKELAQSERRIRDLKRDLERQKAETNQYIDQHQVQVACAFANEVARGEGEYSEKTRQCARVASVYCAVAMLSGSFRRKVAATRRYVDAAEARAQSLKKRIAARKKELETQQTKLRTIQDEIDRTAFEVAAVRQKLGLEDGLQPSLPRGPET